MHSEEQNGLTPFHDDLLDRKKSADFLTNYLIGRHRVSGSVKGNESFVLNVNAEWGLGKTYFLKEWARMLRSLGHPVVYFDAWENDYSANPFVGFMAEIERQLTQGLGTKAKVKRQATSVFRTGAKVIRAAAPTVALAVVKNFSGLDMEKLADIVKDSAIDAVSEVKRDLEKENKNLREAISAFKKSFEQFAKTAQEENTFALPIFLMVDELDRCRPTYAIELLENIKHIFRIPNVYTIVATDSQQLAHSIKAIYGAEFDSRKYLRRFFDHESRLDSPTYALLAAAILEQRSMTTDSKIENVLEHPQHKISRAEILAAIANTLKVTTRDFIRAIDILDTIRITYSAPIDLIFMSFLIMLYISHGEIFDAYQQNPNGTSMKNNLSAKVDHRVSWTEMSEVQGLSRGYTPQKTSVYIWLMKYLEGIWSPRPEENTDSFYGIRNAVQRFRNGSTAVAKQSDLQQYHSIVSMAGHFSL